MKKKLLVIVGAGASIDFGLPSVAKVDELLDKAAQEFYPLVSDPCSNLFHHCRTLIQRYYDRSPSLYLRKSANFEEVLYLLNQLSGYLSDPYRQQGASALLRPVELPEVLHFGTTKPVDGSVVRSLTAMSIDALVDHFIDTCAQIPMTKSAELGLLRQFMTDLQDRFEIGILTLNYDNVLTQALPGLHTGFDPTTGTFDALSVMTRQEWNFIYHLHGSIHFAMRGVPAHDMHGITWAAKPTKDDTVHAFGRNPQASVEGISYPTSHLVAGYGKTQQILRQPFRTYFAQANRLIYEADSLLFLGYGFADFHLNAIFSEVRIRRRPIVIIDWANDDQDPLQFRRDTWSYQLFRTLPGDQGAMTRSGHISPTSIDELKSDNELEVSNNPKFPLAVWYNGLLGALQNSKKILPHLV